MAIDTHTHLDFEVFDPDRDAVMARSRAAGVEGVVIIGSDHEDWARTERIGAELGAQVIVGVHPWSTPQLDEAALAPFLELLRGKDSGWIGEIGLDALHVHDDDGRRRQREGFRAQLALARELGRRVVLHCVRAWPELAVILERDGVPEGSLVHAWGGPADILPRYLALGLHIAVGTLALRDRARKVRETVPLIPDDRLLLETDCPDGRPLGALRGEPCHLRDVAAAVAGLRGQRAEEVWALGRDNALRLGLGKT